MQLLRSITKQAVQNEVLDKDPCVSVKRLEEQVHDIDPFDEHEVELLLSKVERTTGHSLLFRRTGC